MTEHPIEGLMITAMNSIKDMIDVNTIIGEPIKVKENIIIIPISKVTFGFAAGGSEFSDETITQYNKRDKDEQINYKLPFGGGAGAGVAINPVAFIIINNDNVKLTPVTHASVLDKLLDYVPDLLEKTSDVMNKCINSKKEEIKKVLKKVTKEEKQENKDQDTEDMQNKENTIKTVSIEKKIKKPEPIDFDIRLDDE